MTDAIAHAERDLKAVPLAEERFATSDSQSAHLIAQAARGNHQAQAALLRQMQDVWYRFCLSNLREPEMARDAVQETALRFLQRLHTFDGRSELQTWSLGIAINVCRELIRKRSKDQPKLVLAGSDKTTNPAEQAASREQAEKVRSLVEELSDRQREAVLLRFFEELSLEQTAEVMKCAVGTVKATLSQAIARLGKQWGNEQ